MLREFFRKPAVHVLILGVIVAAAVLVAKGPPAGDEARRVVAVSIGVASALTAVAGRFGGAVVSLL